MIQDSGSHIYWTADWLDHTLMLDMAQGGKSHVQSIHCTIN